MRHLSRRMSRTGISLGVATAAMTLPVMAIPAHADPGGNPSLQFCRSIAKYYEGNIVGPCTSYFQSHNYSAEATAAYFCRQVFVPAGEFATEGECVSTIGKSL
jgi:hypothetical protein